MYLPFLDGKYSVAPALQPLAKVETAYDKLIFQVDDKYQDYIENKVHCRREDISKYYGERNLPALTAAAVNKFIVLQLVTEHNGRFTYTELNGLHKLCNAATQNILLWHDDWIAIKNEQYTSLFDGLASQVQEDVAICQLAGDKDWLAALHICSPNHWSAADKLGKPFNAVHAIVPGMEKTMAHYFKMLLTAVHKGPFTRFAWGISTDNRLNHHPVAPSGVDARKWQGRQIEKGCELFVRVERQTLTGLPASNAFLFTIRTYFYPVPVLALDQKKSLVTAVESMSDQALLYKGLSGKVDLFRSLVLQTTR